MSADRSGFTYDPDNSFHRPVISHPTVEVRGTGVLERLQADIEDEAAMVAMAAYEWASAPLRPYWEDARYEEVVVNRFGEIACKTGPYSWHYHNDPAISEQAILDFLRIISNMTKGGFHPRRQPFLYADIPSAGHRVSALWGGFVRYNRLDAGGVALAIRKIGDSIRPWDAWGVPTDGAELAGSRRINLARRYHASPRYDLLEVVYHGGSVLFSGTMGTGKTAMAMRLLEDVRARTPDLRVATVQDALELVINFRNRVHLKADRVLRDGAAYTPEQWWTLLLDFLKRITPDLAAIGEISSTNAKTALDLINLGIPSVSTAHGNSAPAVVVTIFQCYANTHPSATYAQVCDLIEANIARIVHIEVTEARDRRMTANAIPGVDFRARDQYDAAQFQRDKDAARRAADAAQLASEQGDRHGP